MEKEKTKGKIYLPESKQPRIVIIGGGFAGIAMAKELKNKPVQVVLIDKNNFHQFQPLLYQVATSGIEPDSIAFPLRKLFKGYGNVYFRMANVANIDTANNTVHTDIGSVAYNCLILATGSDTNFFGMEDMQRYSIGMKSIQEALDIRSIILQHLEEAVVACSEEERNALTSFAIIGGGPAGVETAGALAEFKKHIVPKDYTELNADRMTVHLVEAAPKLLGAMSENASKKSLDYLKQMGVNVLLNTLVKSYDGHVIRTADGSEIVAKTVIWTAGVRGNVPMGIDPEKITRGNRILVDERSKVIGYDNIHAIGDIAAMITEEYPNGHPMVAQVAIQQGKLLAKNILLKLQGEAREAFMYKDKGSLATVGKQKAVADLGKLKFSGFIAWILWSVVHLLSISGFRNKVLVGLNWAWSYLTYDKGNRLIIRKYTANPKKYSENKPVPSETS